MDIFQSTLVIWSNQMNGKKSSGKDKLGTNWFKNWSAAIASIDLQNSKGVKEIKLHDTVKLSVAIKNIAEGTEGIVVYIHKDGDYEVEFIIDGKNTVETVLKTQLQ